MKNRGVIIAMILIIIAGAGVTSVTRRFISDKTSGSSASLSQFSTSNETGVENMPLTAAGLGAPVPESAEGTGRQPAAADNDEAVQARTFSEASEQMADPAAEDAPQTKEAGQSTNTVLISPLTGSDESLEALSESSVTLEGFRKKLGEIDSLIQNMQGSEANSNTDSLKNIADYEYRLLDTELNHIYQSILLRMNEEAANELRAEEREWIRVRDLEAKKAASKYKGGTMESLEYTASLSGSTRSRAHELLDNYGQYLVQESDLLEEEINE